MKKITYILLVLLFVVLLSGCKKDTPDNNTPTEPEENNLSPYGVYEDEGELINHLKDYYSRFTICDTGVNFDFNNKKEYTVYDLSNDNINHLAYNYLKVHSKFSYESNENSVRRYTFFKKDFDKALITLFGSKFASEYKYDDIKIGNYVFKLDGDIYKGPTIMESCLNIKNTNYQIASYTKNEDNIYTIVNYLYYSGAFDSNDTTKVNYYENATTSEYKSSFEELDKNNLKKIAFNFKREGNNFILLNITEFSEE